MSATPDAIKATFATSAGHWYTAAGEPRYTIVGKNGIERATTLRDARTLNLRPSVTTVLQVLAKPGLETWKQQQAILSALTLPRLDGETDQQFAERAASDAKEQGIKAADRGTSLHGSLELAVQGKPYPAEHAKAVSAAQAKLDAIGIDIMAGNAERCFVHQMGYGCKTDLHGTDANIVPYVLDWKSKDLVTPDIKAYDEHGMQLAANGVAIHGCESGGLVGRRHINVFLDIHGNCEIREWSAEETARHWQMFRLAFQFWCLSKQYNPAVLP